LTSATR